MYNKEDLKISGNRILVKEYDGTQYNGVNQFNWVTLLEINQDKCIYSLYHTMNKILETFIK